MNEIRSAMVAVVVMVLLASAAPAGSAEPEPQAAASSERLAELCDGCALVSEVKTETRKGKGGLLGLAGGAVLGGVLGHQIGGGTGKTLATVGGAAAGAYAGNQVQKSAGKTTVWLTRVTLRDGSVRTFENSADPGFKLGEVVRVEGATLRKR